MPGSCAVNAWIMSPRTCPSEMISMPGSNLVRDSSLDSGMQRVEEAAQSSAFHDRVAANHGGCQSLY